MIQKQDASIALFSSSDATRASVAVVILNVCELIALLDAGFTTKFGD